MCWSDPDGQEFRGWCWPRTCSHVWGLVDLAKRNEGNAERDCNRLMSKRLGLTIPIRKHYLKKETRSKSRIPFLRFRDWLSFLIQHNCTHILAGLVRPDHQREGDIWQAFWERYEKQNPEHPIFARVRAGEVNLRRCVPLLLHGDEGRSKQRQPFLILNLHSPLGRGVAGALEAGQKKRYLKMLPNFLGHSCTNRFLVSAVTKKNYTGKNAGIFKELLQTVAEELLFVTNSGVQLKSGERWWGCFIGLVGDWPWLAKCGLDRSFMNVLKHKGPENGAVRDCKGICHLCSAGKPNYPYEQINSKTPLWEASILQETPFPDPSPFEIVPHTEGQLPALYHYDLFHCFHLGMGKNFLGSALSLLAALEPQPTVDQRFESLSASYVGWCRANHVQAHCQRITKEHLSWNQSYPTATWHKGDLTTSLMRYVEARFTSENWDDHDPMLVGAGQAAVAINTCFRLIYNSEAWIEPERAKLIAQHGLRFLRRYASLASDAHRRGLKHWLIMPKAHALHHIFLGMWWASAKGPCLNPLCLSVQQDEDYIGRGSRLSRHVHTNTCEERVVDRHMMAVYAEYVQCGYLIRAKGS